MPAPPAVTAGPAFTAAPVVGRRSWHEQRTHLPHGFLRPPTAEATADVCSDCTGSARATTAAGPEVALAEVVGTRKSVLRDVLEARTALVTGRLNMVMCVV